MKIQRAFLYWLLLCTVLVSGALGANAQAGADVPSLMGGGNFTNGEVTPQVLAQFKALNTVGAKMCRINVYPSVYLEKNDWGKPNPRVLDRVMEEAHRQGITPILLFEYYADYYKDIGFGTKAQWYNLGRAFAERFRPGGAWAREKGIRGASGITVYAAMNEPEGTGLGAEKALPGLGPSAYKDALEGLADGVHFAERSLKVIPGGFKNPNARRDYRLDGLGPVIAPLLNDGKLDGIDLHTYYDVDHAPMEGRYDRSAQANFDDVKKACGINRDIRFYATEFNYKLRGPNDTQKKPVTQEEAAKGFLTGIWDNLGVVGRDGSTSVTALAFPWNIFHDVSKDPEYGMNIGLDPWRPTPRGKVLAMVLRLTAGMKFSRLDPRRGGEYVLRGAGKTLWVWQNRPGWSRQSGRQYMLRNVPRGTTRIEIYGWEGLRRTVSVVSGLTAVPIANLPPGETYLFLGNAE